MHNAKIIVFLLEITLSSQVTAKETGYVFVSDERTNDVAVIDARHEHRVIKRIQTSRRPRDMAFRNDHHQLLVACGDDDVIDVIEIADLAVTDHIPTGADPEGFGLSRDQKMIYVANKAGSTVQQISVDDKIIEHEIGTGAEPGDLAVSSDGGTLYVTSQISDWVHVVDLGAGWVTHNIAIGMPPGRVLLMPNELWVASERSAQVSIIDRATNRVAGHIDFRPPGTRPFDVTPAGLATTADARTVFVALGRADSVAFVDVSTRKVTHYVPVGRDAGGLALSPDEKTLYVANRLSDDVSIVAAPSGVVIKKVAVGGAPHAVRADN
jgi:YVTN family beta-propeller protein